MLSDGNVNRRTESQNYGISDMLKQYTHLKLHFAGGIKILIIEKKNVWATFDGSVE